jgi:hypothetical protein
MIKRCNCIGEFNGELEKFIDKYNTHRPRQSPDFLTPMEHIERRMINEGDFSQRWWARTFFIGNNRLLVKTSNLLFYDRFCVMVLK